MVPDPAGKEAKVGPSPATGLTWHLSPEPHWAAHAGKASYTPERFAEEGFIHCTNGDERLIEVGNRYYTADPRPFLALQVDLAAAGSPAIYEDPEQVYPHIYGELATAAVRQVRRIVRGADGAFVGIGEVVEAAGEPGAGAGQGSEGRDRR
ncbi:MAG: DUF952 domain-containing protein [Thermomicrobiales bacterium]